MKGKKYVILGEIKDGEQLYWSDASLWGDLDMATVYDESDWAGPIAGYCPEGWTSVNEVDDTKMRAVLSPPYSINKPTKYPIGGFAPGYYRCTCVSCGKTFMGDKRATQCEPCATKGLTRELTQDELLERAFVIGYLNQENPDNKSIVDKIASGDLIDKWNKAKQFLNNLNKPSNEI